MTARDRVLRAYGGRCAWNAAHPGPYEIDHIDGGGNDHRRRLTTSLEGWLCRERQALGYWPLDYQLLCRDCHRRKTRRDHMPPRKGATSVNITLSDAMASQLALLSQESQHHGNKSAVVEHALERLLDEKSGGLALDGLHQHVASSVKGLLQALHDVEDTVQRYGNRVQQDLTTMQQRLLTLESKVTTLERDLARTRTELVQAYDRLSERLQPPKTGGFSSIFRPH